MDIKIKNKGTFSFLGTLSIIFICGFMIIALGLNNNIEELDSQRNTYLDRREQAIKWVTYEVLNYISVVDELTWLENRGSDRLDEYARNQIYGSSYSNFKLPKVKEYKFLETQYTIENEDFKVYVKMLLSFDEVKNQEAVFVVTVRENRITDIVVY